MSSNTENTEAKLAAYIDGQLDAAERAQIEQYLQSNPEHRKLLADMIAQRDVLRSLPREKAPADIYDALQAQLERSVLLDDSGQAAAPVVRHSRRSQLFAVAAILLLAIGLGGVLYFALPSTRQNAMEVATIGRPAAMESSNVASQPTTVAAAENAEKGPEGTVTIAKTRTKPGAQALAEGPATQFNPNVVSNFHAPNPTYQALSGATADARDLAAKALGGQVGAAGQLAIESNQLVLLVSAEDPSKVNQEVASYLDSNKIRWEAVNAPSEQVLYSRTAGPRTFARKEKSDVAAADKVGTSVPAAPAAEVDAARALADTQAGKQLTPAPADADRYNSQVVHQEQKEQLVAPSSGQPEEQFLESTQQKVATRYFSDLAKDANKDSSRQIIVARGMTRQQAVDLTDTLSADGTARRARLIGQAPTHVTVAKRFDDRQQAALKLSPSPTAAAEAKSAVAEDSLAATVAPAAPQQELGLSATDGVKKAEPAESEPASQPATAPAADETALATTVPATQPVQTEPAVDVVILVEDESPLPTTTTGPTTQSAPEY